MRSEEHLAARPVEERLERLLEALSRIQVSLEALRIELAGLSHLGRDHEDRLRLVERWKHQLTPVLAAVTFVLGALATLLLQRWL